jgi:hypothetical protein
MTDKPENPQAFPAGWPQHGYEPHYGMTLRDYFAGKALPSVMHLCARDTLAPAESITQSFARKAYEIADAMLAERVK